MAPRKRSIITVSVPPEMAKEYRDLAREQGETASSLFRSMLKSYKKEKLKEQFNELREYGTGKAAPANLTEAEIERLIFEDR